MNSFRIEDWDKLKEFVGDNEIIIYQDGEPSPQGSGNGWSGWYKDWYFRSLGELSYMINVIERFDFKWESAERKVLKIEYINWDGEDRTYYADFLIEGKYIVECKPKKLWNSVNVRLKAEAAKLFCEQSGFKYKLIDPVKLTDEKIYNLYKKGEIKFLEKYERKFKERYKK